MWRAPAQVSTPLAPCCCRNAVGLVRSARPVSDILLGDRVVFSNEPRFLPQLAGQSRLLGHAPPSFADPCRFCVHISLCGSYTCTMMM